jgi:FkbM family methyltransferase
MTPGERVLHLKRAWWTNKGWRARLLHVRRAAGGRFATVAVSHARLKVDLCDRGQLGQVVYLTRTYEPQESAALTRLASPESVVLDIGANIGYYTTLLAQRCAHVYAIEPAPGNVRLLKHNTRRHRNVTVIPTAVSDREGTSTLSLSDVNNGDHQLLNDPSRVHISVPVTTIDALVRQYNIPRIDLIKIDVQGAEVAAFRGMQQTLAENPHAVIVAEYWGHGLKAAGVSLCDWFASLGPATFSRISPAGEEQVPEQWFAQQADDHYESIVIRLHQATARTVNRERARVRDVYSGHQSEKRGVATI